MSQRRKDETLSTSAEHVGRTIAPVAARRLVWRSQKTRERQAESWALAGLNQVREQIGETIEAAFPDRAPGRYLLC